MGQTHPWLRIVAMLMTIFLLVNPPLPVVHTARAETVPAQPDVQSTKTTTVKATIYSKAKTSSKKLRTIKAGTSVSVIAENDKWVKINYKGGAGYIKASAFRPRPTPTPKPSKAPTTRGELMTVVASSAKLYAKASTSANSSAVSRGEHVRVLSIDGKWCRVQRGDDAGYMPTSAFTLATLDATKMYQEPSTGSKSVSIKKGTKLMVVEMDDNWTSVRMGKKKGHVRTALLVASAASPEPSPAPTAQTEAAAQIIDKLAFATPAPTQPPVEPDVTPAPAPATAQPQTPDAADAQSAKDATQKPTAVKSYLFQRPSLSSKRVTVKAGTVVSVYESNEKWAKVKVNGKAGYMRMSAFVSQTAPAAPVPTATATKEYKTLKIGSRGAAVTKLQQRLEMLAYLDTVPNGKYTSTTAASIREFQGNVGLKKTGIADNKTQQALYSSDAPKSAILDARLELGNKGTAVKRLQLRLRTKHYSRGRISGTYGEATRDAVRLFQTQTGLGADGIAGSRTLAGLYLPQAPEHNNEQPGVTMPPIATPAPTGAPTKPPSESAPNPSRAKNADIVINAAMAKLGRPYVFGASGPNSFDCSGFMVYAYKTVGISLPHSAYQMGYFVGNKIGRSELQRGDLVFWNTVSDSDLSDHVGIYLGNGQAIHASSGTGRVIISSIDSGYYQRVFSWGRSVFD